MFELTSSGDGLWLASALWLVLLGLYAWLVLKLIIQLRHSSPSGELAQAAQAPFSLQRVRGLAAVAALLLGLLCFVPLFDHWISGYSGYHSIGGLIPYSDAADWLHGTLHLITQGELTDWSARRPLNAVFLSGLLQLGDGNIVFLLMLRAGLVACVVGCWFRELQRQMPLGPALGTSLLVVLLAYPHLPTLLSETHGLLFGLLGFTLLLRGVSTQHLTSYAVGAGLLSCALMLRMGAFGILLSLLVWPLALAGSARRLRWVLATAVAICLGIGLSLLWGALIYSGENTSGSNFSYTLYGLAHGGEPWQLFFSHYPKIAELPEAAQASAAYQAAWAQIQTNPSELLQGWWRFFANYWRYLFVWVPGSLGHYLMPVFALGLGQIIWGWRELNNRFLLICFAGVLLTAPWIYWSANASRAFIATTAVELLMVGRGLQVLMLGGRDLWRQTTALPTPRKQNDSRGYGLGLTVAASLACLSIIPSLFSTSSGAGLNTPGPKHSCVEPSQTLWLDPKLALVVELNTGSKTRDVHPNQQFGGITPGYLSRAQFAKHQINPNPFASALTQTDDARTQLWWVFDATNPQRYRYLLLDSPTSFVGPEPRAICIEALATPGASSPTLWRAVAS